MRDIKEIRKCSCCFTGHRPEKLIQSETVISNALLAENTPCGLKMVSLFFFLVWRAR